MRYLKVVWVGVVAVMFVNAGCRKDSGDRDDGGDNGGDGGDGDGGDDGGDTLSRAGSDQTVSVGDDVTLGIDADEALASGTLTYAWTQTAGPTVTLMGAKTAQPTFSPGEVATYTFLLTTTAGDSIGTDTDTDTVTVTAQGIQSENFYVDIYHKSQAMSGTTLFYDAVDSAAKRLVELNLRGEAVWQYAIPSAYTKTSTIGLDAEKLSNGNYIFFSGAGIYEITDAGVLVWSTATTQISHDLQRLPNGDTLYNFGDGDTYDDAQMKRVNDAGEVVWSWYARDHIAYNGEFTQGWTHANAVIWQSDDSLFINLRNQYKTLQVNADGDVIWEMDWSVYGTDVDPHEPDILANGNMLICLQNDAPYVAIEIDRSTKQAVWTYANTSLRTARDCDRLPNGNTLIVAVNNGGTNGVFTDDYSTMIEVNDASETVWRLTANTRATGQSPGFFYKAERLPSGWTPSTTAD